MHMPSPLTILIGVALGLAISELFIRYGMMGFGTVQAPSACASDDQHKDLAKCACFEDKNVIRRVAFYVLIGVAVAAVVPMILAKMRKTDGDRQLSPMSP